MKIVIFDDLKIVNFFFIIKYIIKRSDIYYIKKEQSRFYRFYEFLFFNKIKPLTWKFRDLKTDKNMNLYLHLLYYELEPLLEEIINKILKYSNLEDDKYIRVYLLRELANSSLKPYNNKSILEIIYIINSLKIIFEKETKSIVYFLNYFPFSEFIENYANKNNVGIKISKLNALKYSSFLIFYHLYQKLRSLKNLFRKNYKYFPDNIEHKKIIIEHSLVINNVNYFMKNSLIDKRNCILVNTVNNYQEKDISLAKKAGYDYLDLRNFSLKNINLNKINFFDLKFFDTIYLKIMFEKFFIKKEIWKHIFKKLNAKTYLSSQFMNKDSIPTASALNELNGTSIFYSTSYYERADPSQRFICDIYLSPGANTVNNIDEKFTYFKFLLQFGYTNSYKINLMEKNAIKIRKSLLDNNVKKIISFYDQGELKNDMFSMGYLSSLEGYKFLLNKLLENKWLGLIIKPKKPGLLKYKLSKINNLLNECLLTNRLVIISEGSGRHVKNFDHPPCESAMAADLAIHDTMAAATAGIEAYLSNTKTIFFDRYNFFDSRFYKNTQKIVYQDWDKLWNDTLAFFEGKNNNFGTWDKEIIEQIDIFRDNESDKRIAYITQKIYDMHNSKTKKNIDVVIEDYKKFWKIYDK